MSFANFDPPPLKIPIRECNDDERKIHRKCWNLDEVQAAVASGELTVELTTSAQETMFNELRLTGEQLLDFIKCLHKARYHASEWCLPSDRPKAVEKAADAYCMGFNRFKGVENQAAKPWIYFKFTVQAKTLKLLVFSMHPERPPRKKS